MRDTRLHSDEPLAAGQPLALGAATTHRLRSVLRARPGQRLRVFNADSGEWRAVITRLERHEGLVELEERLRPPMPEPGPTLLFAPLKRPRLEYLLEKAVELGVARLVPVRCRYGVVENVKPERLQQRLIEAVEQCERLSLPELAPETDLIAAVEASAQGVLMADERGGRPLLPALAAQPAAALLVGPEGGFSGQEHDKLRQLPHVVPVGLGPTILRAETACLMLLACHRAGASANAPAVETTRA